MSLLTALTSMVILGIQNRYWLIGAVVLVILVAAFVVVSRRRATPRFDLRDLDPADSQRYIELFADIEREFVDHPDQAAARARGVAEEVMRRRGFPDRIEPAQRIRDLGSHDREASSSLEAANAELGRAGGDTERLRKVVQHYRVVVYRLTGTPLDQAA